MLCQITFRIEVDTSPDETVKLVGNIKELGNWNIDEGLQLITSEADYPFWTTSAPLAIKKGEYLQIYFQD